MSTSPPCPLAGSLMATKTAQCPASPAELARAVVRGPAVHHLQKRASPPQGDPSAFLQTQLFQYASSPNYATVRLGTYDKCRGEAFCSPSWSLPAARGHPSIPRPAEHWHLGAYSYDASLASGCAHRPLVASRDTTRPPRRPPDLLRGCLQNSLLNLSY